MISKKTFQEIISFFENQKNNSPKFPSILFLFGPSGSGKNSTINFLVKKYGFSPKFKEDIIDYAEKLNNMDNIFEKSNEPEKEYKFSKQTFLESALRKAKDPFLRYYFNDFVCVLNDRNRKLGCFYILKEIPKTVNEKDVILRNIINNFVSYNVKKCPIVFILNSTIFAENIIQKNYEHLFGDCAKKIR